MSATQTSFGGWRASVCCRGPSLPQHSILGPPGAEGWFGFRGLLRLHGHLGGPTNKQKQGVTVALQRPVPRVPWALAAVKTSPEVAKLRFMPEAREGTEVRASGRGNMRHPASGQLSQSW